ncbi:hypothetical protein BU24DRAFT_344510 [Aaosphaeria arxii CBS 175.79]|uniref:Cell wall mannoprotein PIR1-like C-terminal domain-containing protein n=1 Tax=Aaosphaeria arxii CBS 175.79 TaxID=1450172 RepID=A0A6A5XYM1_9PLEO|nr:uncharacterized protein BU24DRAFT_344510 [Aaosphaeria arxii CBS 175.79]KAF2017374.1 hypothetical protein BU24DRAFT_344510 [Aaosphaeria arxii CBS 175.79]
MPQAVTSAIAPEAPAPSGCSESHDGKFQISVVNVTSSAKRDVEKRQQAGILTLTLANGILTDQADRTGYIASNYQFQFDAPPQAGAIYTSGFSLCSNNSLALGGSSIFYQCWSGSFHNLYDRKWAEHCVPIYLVALTGGGGGSPVPTQISDGQPQVPTNVPVSQISDGQPQAPTGYPPVSQISDGQPQVPTGAPVISQISDGQPQVPTAAPVISQISDGQPQVPTGAPVISQISDGQPQVPTGAPVISQISDGQPQVPTGAPVISQISDGQPQVPTGPVVSQISDGQPQVPTVVPPGPVITQISDGQPQVPTGPLVSQISDGQPQAPVATGNFSATVSAPPTEFTGAAASAAYGLGAIAAGVMGAVALL